MSSEPDAMVRMEPDWHFDPELMRCNPYPEVYSRKVFVGGLPFDADKGTFLHRGILWWVVCNC